MVYARPTANPLADGEKYMVMNLEIKKGWKAWQKNGDHFGNPYLSEKKDTGKKKPSARA
ncbi:MULTISPECIES: hypothetical protein [Mucilaginibacter]|uniref:DUF1738 domain-containing protein n=1 Tax=Mucilaginibacter rubeus TaxID=2027860 RepID=A0ABX7UJI5_9SPHI|nr:MULTISPECIES: hypothetical protein [Mucilaginibacter]QTE46105.1 hypothetical protein J3L19_12385 [Mucilaginibacter rubeus]QTE52703.1 hypothetical protein J3L21_12360 [Mucilaginibacter rubeus]QTE57790.1 hypothetical protein J3L23_04035 [Mucilaginibacter rubeus]QTE62749.1 hypothetical protein J3L22_29825 [Mucilaginibacter rubeus]QTF61506.1 hypothetical protein J3L20_29455 [Mucilaginibacter rubeus]